MGRKCRPPAQRNGYAFQAAGCLNLRSELEYGTSFGSVLADTCASVPPPQPLVRTTRLTSAAALVRRRRRVRRASIPLFCSARYEIPTGPNDQGGPPNRLFSASRSRRATWRG